MRFLSDIRCDVFGFCRSLLSACSPFIPFQPGAEKQDFFEQIPIIIRELLYRLNDDDQTVLKATNLAFAALSKEVSAEELVKHVEFMRNLIASMVSEARRRKGGVGDGEFLLPGFNIPKGKGLVVSFADFENMNENDDQDTRNVLPDFTLGVFD